MATQQEFEFVFDSVVGSPAKRKQEDGSPNLRPARRRGRGNYTEVSERATALKNGRGTCWRCRYLKKLCDDGEPCEECRRNSSGYWGLHPDLGCRREKLTELACHLFPESMSAPDEDCILDDQQPFSELLDAMSDHIKQLSTTLSSKPEIIVFHSSLQDLVRMLRKYLYIDKHRLLFPQAFQYLLVSLKLANILAIKHVDTSSGDWKYDCTPSWNCNSHTRGMKVSITKALQQLEKVMFKKTDVESTLTIVFTLVVIEIGTWLRSWSLDLFGEKDPTERRDYSMDVRNRWQSPICALFTACKSLQAWCNWEESVVDITWWVQQHYRSFSKKESIYQKFHYSGLHVGNIWQVTTLHSKIVASCAGGHRALVQLLLRGGSKNNYMDEKSKWMEGLHWASRNGHDSVVNLILSKGERVSMNSWYGQTPLHLASASGHQEVVRILLEQGADDRAVQYDDDTALHLAVNNRHEAVVRLLLDHGTNFEARDGIGRTALHLAAINDNEAVVQLLLEHGINVEVEDESGSTPLHLAAVNDNKAVVQLLLEHDVNVDTKDGIGSTALHLAAKYEKWLIIQQLLKHGIHVEAKNESGSTALHLAAKGWRGATVPLLLGNGANIEATDKLENTALHIAVESGSEANVQLLLKHGVNIEAKNKGGSTALHLAATNWNAAIVQILLRQGANIEAKNKMGRTILHLAAEEGNTKVLQLLLKHKVNIEAKDNSGSTALQIAIQARLDSGSIMSHEVTQNRCIKVIQLLLNYGANIKATNGWGERELHWAAEKRRSLNY